MRLIASLIGTVILGAAAASPVSAAAPADACSLLTQAQVSAALGISVNAGMAGGPFLCQWAQPDDKSSGRKMVILNLIGQAGNLTPADRFAIAKAPVEGITKTPVSGIGDDAFYVTTNSALGNSLTVKKGISVFRIMILGISPDQIKAVEKTLALDALSRL